MDERIKLAEEALPLTTGKMLMEEPEAMSLSETACSFAVCKILSDKIEERMKVLRAHLLKQAEAHGEGNEGTTKLDVNGTIVERQRRESKTPNADGIQKLLESKKMDIKSVFDERMVLEMNVSKIENLVRLGKLPKADVEALKAVTYALKVTPAPMLKQMLDEGIIPGKKKLFSR